MSFLSQQAFSQVIANTPLVSIDLIIENPQGQVLLGQRLNRPAQGFWFVPGGRIMKDESMRDALTRLARQELGLELTLDNGEFLGSFEHFYHDNVFYQDTDPQSQFSTHYVVLAYRYRLRIDLALLPEQQHGQYRWFSAAELLSSDEVHQHTKWYLEN
ncbi:GDP-mannose mannosyl hydrolase [Agarivorans sp. MS3-6]|uniref:GDP-mannose mannosyl hydrolase n=1 Tax=Agarivorans sp. TSD2052 TaxID=2937286 RepID=UPI00200CB424|nr:GDP-mannose mannosyl hydrolase [Agarivorans sp. TSD2052]UPW18262.1 GDP-mannose mannosyl hydrolase [Agarivorans sp. TSD2052]